MKNLNTLVSLLLILLAGAYTSLAQENPYSVGLRYGYSLPMGQFASHKYGYGAYALLGSSFSAEGIRYFRNGLGVGANFSMSYYQIASGYFLEDMNQDTTNTTTEYLFLRSDPYEVKCLNAGVYYSVLIFKRFNASFKGTGGVCWAKSPYQFYTGQYLIGDLFHIVTPAKSTRFTYQVGATINYKLFDHVVLLLESEFTYAEAKFTFWKNGGTTRDIQFIRMPLFKLQPGLNITF